MWIIHGLLLLLIAGIAGSIGQAIVGVSRSGCLISIVVGFIGSLLGSWLATQMGLPALFVLDLGGTPFPVVWAIIGSALFVAIISLLTGRR